MKRALTFASVGALILAVAILIWAGWPSRTSAVYPPAKPTPSILPVDTRIPVRLTGVISEDSKPGDTLQGVVADSVLVNSQIAIPINSRAVVALIRIRTRKDEVANVIVELKELTSKDRNVQVPSEPIETSLNLTSDVDLIARSMAGLIGSAVGAAGSASFGRSPDVGAARMGDRLSAGTTEPGTPKILVFKTAKPIDLTTVVW